MDKETLHAMFLILATVVGSVGLISNLLFYQQ